MRAIKSLAEPGLILVLLKEEEAQALRKGKKPHVKNLRRELKKALR